MHVTLKAGVNIFHVQPCGSTGTWESTKHGPLVPPPWTRSMDRVHQNMDWVHGPPIFTTPKITEVKKKKKKSKVKL